MKQNTTDSYMIGFLPYALATLMIGLVGGFSTVLGPAFVQDMQIAYSNTTWTALAQAMSTAACAPVLGRLGDAIGRRRTLLLGISVYTLGNVLSALAPSLAVMLIARFILGIGTAAMAPVIMAYIVAKFPEDKAAKGFSLYMLISSASVIFGPTLGGLMVEEYGWRAMLWVCVAICVAVLLICAGFNREGSSKRVRSDGFDRLGAALVPIFFSLVLCIPAFGQNIGWSSAAFVCVLLASLIFLAALIFAEKRAENPILRGSFIKRKAFILSMVTLFLTQGLLQANMTDIIVFVNYTQPDRQVISGYAISVMYVGMSIGAVVLGPLADRLEPKLIVAGSLLATGAGCALMLLFSESTALLLLMTSLGILGFGLGGNATVLMKVVLSDVSAEDAATGTGIYGLFRDLAAPFGVAVLVPMFTNRVTENIAGGQSNAHAAVAAIRLLAAVELLCVAVGIAVALMLPKIHNGKEQKYEIKE